MEIIHIKDQLDVGHDNEPLKTHSVTQETRGFDILSGGGGGEVKLKDDGIHRSEARQDYLIM